jgi:hypothetical protein
MSPMNQPALSPAGVVFRPCQSPQQGPLRPLAATLNQRGQGVYQKTLTSRPGPRSGHPLSATVMAMFKAIRGTWMRTLWDILLAPLVSRP